MPFQHASSEPHVGPGDSHAITQYGRYYHSYFFSLEKPASEKFGTLPRFVCLFISNFQVTCSTSHRALGLGNTKSESLLLWNLKPSGEIEAKKKEREK